ncbi:inosine triphosphate pyrophosphatase [Nematocida sp. AWRm80]|nr:inosine triphosphate pyrophosphatase [Nematocida sp. AWRm80]
MISIVTGSPRKKDEITRYIDGRIEYQFVSYDLDEIQGTATEIIEKKAREAYKLIKGPLLVEDYSLYIDFLGGFPGPYIKSILAAKQLSKIISTLSALGEIKCRGECTYGYIDQTGKLSIISADHLGVLIPPESEEKATGLYGVDGSLIIEGTNKPFSELSKEEQDRVSVRRHALDKLITHIKNEEQKNKQEYPIKNLVKL